MRVIHILFFCFLYTLTAQKKQTVCDNWQQRSDTITDLNNGIKLDFSYLNTVPKNCKVRIYVDLGSIYFNKFQLDSSYYYLDKAIALATKIGAEEELAFVYAEKVPMLVSQNRHSEVEEMLEKSRKLLTKYPKSWSWVSYYDKMGFFSFLQSDYYTSLDYMDSTVVACKNTGQTTLLHSVYEHRGVLYQKLSDYDKAAENFILSLEAKEKNGTLRDLSTTYQYLASCYIKLKQNATAKRYLDKALQASQKKNNDFALLTSYHRLAAFFRNTRDNKQSEEAINKAIQLALKTNNDKYLATIYREKGLLYLMNYKNYKEAENFFTKAYDAAKESKQESLVIDVLKSLFSVTLNNNNINQTKKYLDELNALIQKKPTPENLAYLEKALSRYYEANNQTEKSLFHLKKHYEIQDSIVNKDIYNKMLALEKQYDTKKKELTISNLNREKEAQRLVVSKAKYKQNLFLIIAIVLLSVLIIGFWVYKKLQKQQKELFSTNQVKNRLFSIIAHDLRGMIIPFQRAGKILKYHIDNKNYTHTLMLSEELEKNSELLSNMLDNLLNWSLEQMNGYKMNPEQLLVGAQIEEIIGHFEEQANFKNSTIRAIYEEDIAVRFDKGAFHVIFRNLIGNALKYTENGTIQIVCKKDVNAVSFSVMDTGVGMSVDQLQHIFTLEKRETTVGTRGEKGTGLGLSLVYHFVKMHQGTIKVSSENKTGTRFDLDFPTTIFNTQEQLEGQTSLHA